MQKSVDRTPTSPS